MIKNLNPITVQRAKQLNSQVLAFAGDGVHTLYVRTMLCTRHDYKTGKLHILASKHIRAGAQAQSLGRIIEGLNEDERAIYMRGRNTKTNTVAKNADLDDYKKSTGFEALIGYLYLSGQTERLNELLNEIYDEVIEREKGGVKD